MISHHSSTGKVMASWPDSALLLEAFPSADSDFVWDSRGGKTEPTTAQKVWKAWGAKLVRLSSLGEKDIDFPSRISRRMGPLSPSCLLLYAELWLCFFTLGTYLRCTGSCLLPRNSGIRTACHNFSLSSFPTLMAGFNFLGSFPVAVRILWCANRFLWGFFPCKKGQHREHRQERCPILMQALSQRHHHIAKPRWLQAGQEL